MVRPGSVIDIYVLRYDEDGSKDFLYRASSVDNAIVTGVRKALKSHLKSYKILDRNYREIFCCGMCNF